jgi:hypothetical protein
VTKYWSFDVLADILPAIDHSRTYSGRVKITTIFRRSYALQRFGRIRSCGSRAYRLARNCTHAAFTSERSRAQQGAATLSSDSGALEAATRVLIAEREAVPAKHLPAPKQATISRAQTAAARLARSGALLRRNNTQGWILRSPQLNHLRRLKTPDGRWCAALSKRCS